MAFTNSILAGTTLARTAISSEGYVAGVSGWIIERDGDAEFNNVTIRGGIIVGPVPGRHITILANPNADINFYSGASTETDPADIGTLVSNSPVANQPFLTITSNETGFDSVDFRMGAPMSGSDDYGFYFINNSTNGQLGQFIIDGDLLTRLNNGTNLNVIGSVNHAFGIGGDSTTNLAFGGQELQARNNGAVSTLFLNRFGGTTSIGGAAVVGSTLNVNGTTAIVGLTTGLNMQIVCSGTTSIQAANNGAGNTLILNPNGTQVFTQGVHNAAGGFLSTNGNLTLSNGQVNAAQLNTNAGTAIGSLVISATGIRGTFATAGAANVNTNSISGKDQIRIATSSRRYKRDIEPLQGFTADEILALNPRQYRRIDEIGPHGEELTGDDVPLQAGFIAEEAHELGLLPWVIHKNQFDMDELDSDGNPTFTGTIIDGFSYGGFAAVGHQIVLRDFQKRIEELERKLNDRANS